MVVQVALITCNQEGLHHPQLQDTVELPERGTSCCIFWQRDPGQKEKASGTSSTAMDTFPSLEKVSSEVCLYLVPEVVASLERKNGVSVVSFPP